MQQTAAIADPGTPLDRSGTGYRPHLDGLRAVAVYLVVLFHAGSDRFIGGFIGVDVFFVLSGYLVTQLLMRDLEAHGRVRFSRFYARRFRRLLPASSVALVATAALYAAVASPAEVSAAIDAFRAAFLYVANWFFIERSTDYFAANIDANPVIHFWSLAVEEQFYLLAPVFLAGLFAVTRLLGRQAVRARQLVVVGVGASSLALALHFRTIDLNRAYYGTDTRAYQLLAGAALALAPGVVQRLRRSMWTRVVPIPMLLALLVLATSVVAVDPVVRGVATTAITLVLVATIEAASGPVTRLLSLPGAVYLGSLSYGTYLWHWPVIVIMREIAPAAPMATFAIASLVATGLASLSFHLLERPIRELAFLDRVGRTVVVSGLAISLVGAVIVVPRLLQTDASAVVAVASGEISSTPVPALDFDGAASDTGDLRDVTFIANCTGRPSSDCTILHGSGQHVLVLGDSHAQMLFPAFAKIAQQNDLSLSTAASGGCPWQRHTYIGYDGGAEDDVRRKDCEVLHEDLYERVIPDLSPDVIVAVSRDYLTRRPGVVFDEKGDPIVTSSALELAALLRADSERSLRELRDIADRVVIIEPVPVAPAGLDPFTCLSEDQGLERCRFVADSDPLPIETIYRALADGRHVWSADLDRVACPFLPVCDPVIGGRIVRFDNQHLAPAYAIDRAEDVQRYLRDAGILETA